MTCEPDTHTLAREAARGAVLKLVRASGAHVGDRVHLGSTVATDVIRTPEPEPLAGLSAVRDLTAHLTRLEQDYARWAREDGRTWDDIAGALGFEDMPDWGVPRSAKAFALLSRASAALGGSRRLSWKCPSCRGAVTDYGPEAGHPADAEHGHAEDCERLAAAVAAYEREGR